ILPSTRSGKNLACPRPSSTSDRILITLCEGNTATGTRYSLIRTSAAQTSRSEERRVGKECRYPWPTHDKKKKTIKDVVNSPGFENSRGNQQPLIDEREVEAQRDRLTQRH